VTCELRGDWLWPAADGVAFEHIQMYLPLLKMVARRCKRKQIAVQAGGNAGMYPATLATMFEKVITFEPDAENFACLQYNCKEYRNVTAYKAAIGNSHEPVQMQEIPGLKFGELCVNTGAFRVIPGGDIPQMRLDDLNLPALDFLQLDIEGFELNALLGGLDTIQKYSPVIMVETVGHGDDPTVLLEELGYHCVVRGHYDQVFVRRHGDHDLC
jgi:FkbM family methyltransferase